MARSATRKHQTPTSAPNTGKRRRTTNAKKTSTVKKSKQQTLTQIQFLPHHSPSPGDDEIQYIDAVPRIGGSIDDLAGKSKHDSTLTQMNFLTGGAQHIVHDSEAEDGLGFISDSINDQDASSGGVALMNRASEGQRNQPSSRKRKGSLTDVVDAQKNKPPSKRTKADADQISHVGKRRRNLSRAVNAKRASVQLMSGSESDSGKSKYVTGKQYSRRSRARTEAEARRMVEHERAMDLGLDVENQRRLMQPSLPTANPTTPRKAELVVPSSQSPDSLPPSTGKRNPFGARSPPRMYQRSPLKDRSTNAQIQPLRPADENSTYKSPEHGYSPQRRVCKLKLTRHNLEMVAGNTALARQEKNSLQPIYANLSPEKIKEQGQWTNPAVTLVQKRSEEELEIPETSQAANENIPLSSPTKPDTQYTFPSLNIVLGIGNAKSADNSNDTDFQHRILEESNVLVEDFACGTAKQSPASPSCLMSKDTTTFEVFDSAHIHPKREASSKDDDELGGFSPGSSIANDTQFNADIANRVATLSPPEISSTPQTPSRQKPSSRPLCHNLMEVGLSPHRSPDYLYQVDNSTTIVPLNDLSSPTLPPRPAQQSQVLPASLPHPSQVSTQEPTQPYLPMSSLPQPQCSSSTACHDRDAITIKDSSSSEGAPLHDLPLQSPSQQSPLHIDLGLDDYIHHHDGDLDPAPSIDNDMNDSDNDMQESQIEQPQQVLTTINLPGDAQFDHPSTTTLQRQRQTQGDPMVPDIGDYLAQSMFESLPGPPGWEQMNSDGEDDDLLIESNLQGRD